MNRRGTLGVIGLGIGVPGCLGRTHHGGIAAAVPTAVDHVSFQRRGQSETTISPRGDPVLSVDWETGTVVTEGNAFVGSSECNQAVLEAIEAPASTVRFRVGPGKSPDHPDYSLSNFSCTEGMGPDAYRVEAVVSTQTNRVEIVEQDALGEERVVSDER